MKCLQYRALSFVDAVKNNGKYIQYMVKKWVERYEADPKSALVEILLMLFEVFFFFCSSVRLFCYSVHICSII